MGLFSRKPKYEEQLSSAKKAMGEGFLFDRINDIQQRLSALEEHLGIYPVNQPKKYVYRKREAGSIGSALVQNLTSRD